jgi:hypothetical protein
MSCQIEFASLQSNDAQTKKIPKIKKHWNFTLQCRLVKYKPDLAKRLKLLASAE